MALEISFKKNKQTRTKKSAFFKKCPMSNQLTDKTFDDQKIEIKIKKCHFKD